jgi:hypothetical protein
MSDDSDISRIADFYRRFAELEARSSSPLYEDLSLGVAADAELLTLLSELPRLKQQPNLLLAASRFVNGTPSGYAEFRSATLDSWDAVVDVMMARRTQTNEVARTAHVVPLLAQLPQPLALLEVGASAGLNLYPDRYRYDYGYATAGDPDSPLTIVCEVDGDIRPPIGPYDVVWRAGLDLNPLDVTDPETAQWLETLVWPGQNDRLARLRTAIDIVAAEPPRLVKGDLLADIDALIAEAPNDATLVVMHSSTLVYVPQDVRDAFAEKMRALDGCWISQEGPGVAPILDTGITALESQPPRSGAALTVSVDGAPKALAAPHGGWIRWLA